MADDTPNTTHPFQEVPIEVSIIIGKAKPKIREMLSLSQDDVLALDRTVDDPVELYVGDKLIARGALEELPEEPGGKLAVRLVEIIAQTDGR
ncbi:FliM/FliN family flagellar motor switch protein [Algirhabdus cladophorae]|uniref:FliM/FliN family flagellar motor switch protein n=1 Tax=Algirhabdus cladophorae TaxID=3377108 RepID=UPI003B84683F